MRISRAKLLKYSPFLAIVAGFAGGALAMSPISPFAAPDPSQAQPAIQLVQAGPLPRATPSSQSQIQLSFAPVAARAEPAVVNVYAERVVRGIVQDPFFRGFGVPVERMQRSLGSGVIVRADGVIVTNNHVIEGAQSLKVVLSDRREFDAQLILADPHVDLAVLRIRVPNEQLPTLPFADTHRTQVGDLVIAIGNPFGLSETVTSGIVSALARTEVGISDYAFYIQTDAAINRGNSGGALVDMSGALVGINSAIFSESNGGSNGIGFAIPSEMVRRVVESAISGGRVVRPWLGAQVQPVTQDLARSLGLSRPEGVLIARLYPNSPATRAGLRNGDVILNVAGTEVHDQGGLRYQFATQRPGVRVPVQILRGNARQTINVAAEAPPGGGTPQTIKGRNPLNGATVIALSPASAEDLGADPFATGVLIQALDGNGVAAQIVQPGDIVTSINGRAVATVPQLEAALNGSSGWAIGINRNGQQGVLRVGL